MDDTESYNEISITPNPDPTTFDLLPQKPRILYENQHKIFRIGVKSIKQ